LAVIDSKKRVRYVATGRPSSGYVSLTVRVRLDQRRWAMRTGNASEAVRDAIDKKMGLL
jgi:hypothetical protein